MASLLRSIVAGPRLRNAEAGLDLCYVTDNIIATSGPSSTYPQRAYRNPTDALVKFLDYKHGSKWAIWEFRAEGTGYPDSEVYDRIHHYPWPDHHPPPFALIPNIMASMRDWLKDPEEGKSRVVVVHCKAGKGRSGSVACSYLISEEGWAVEDALARFTARRMRIGFGSGVSIPSQLRWVRYVDWWTKHGKIYVERRIEILEVHVWGLRDGVKMAVEGFVEGGKIIKTFHTFGKHERIVMDGDPPNVDVSVGVEDHLNQKDLPSHEEKPEAHDVTKEETLLPPVSESGVSAVIFRPSKSLVLPTSDVNLDFERRNKAPYGFTMVTSLAHVWFNAFFESQLSSTASADSTSPPPDASITPDPDTIPTSGVFEIDWEAMDGIKGSARKGTRALDRLAVVWRVVPDPRGHLPKIITEPALGEPVPESSPANWKGSVSDNAATSLVKDLGLRTESPASANVSKASSVTDLSRTVTKNGDEMTPGVKSHGPQGEDHITHPSNPKQSTSEPSPIDPRISGSTHDPPNIDLGMPKVKSPLDNPDMVQDVGFGKEAGITDIAKAASEQNLPHASA